MELKHKHARPWWPTWYVAHHVIRNSKIAFIYRDLTTSPAFVDFVTFDLSCRFSAYGTSWVPTLPPSLMSTRPSVYQIHGILSLCFTRRGRLQPLDLRIRSWPPIAVNSLYSSHFGCTRSRGMWYFVVEVFTKIKISVAVHVQLLLMCFVCQSSMPGRPRIATCCQ